MLTVERASLWISHLLALTSFAALSLSRSIPYELILFAMAAILGNLLARLRGVVLAIPRRLWNAITLLFFLFFVADTLWISQSPLEGGVHFLIYLMFQKLISQRNPKDTLQIHLIAFFLILATADRTTDLSYGLAFVLFLVLTTWALIFYHLRNEGESGGRVFSSQNVWETLSLPFFLWTNALTLMALTTTLLIFVFIPRLGTGFLQSDRSDSQALSGFSEEVQFGTIGPIKRDPTVVMRVRLPDLDHPPTAPLYFRGMSYDRYLDHAWHNTLPPARMLPPSGSRFSIPEGLLTRFSRRQVLLHQEITLEPLASTVLFAASHPFFIHRGISHLMIDPSGALHLPHPVLQRITYEAVSLVASGAAEPMDLNPDDYPEAIAKTYLWVTPNPRLTQLAGQITEKVQSPYEKILAVQHFLGTQYRYRLFASASSGPDPIETFLFDTKEGYCEHYASAMVLLLRHLGIAARLVSGFLHGEWNPFGEYLLVRQQDAHTWVEVYFPEQGWVPFDPTPPVPGGGMTGLFTAYLDWMKSRWDRYIIHYSLLDQIALARDGWDWLKEGWLVRRFPSSSGERLPAAPLPWILSFAAVAVTAWILRRFIWMNGGWTGPRQVREAEATRLYRRFLRMMARRGWPKQGGQTPREYAESLKINDRTLQETIEQITSVYYHTRFGFNESALHQRSEELTRFRNLLQGLDRTIRRVRAASSNRSGRDNPTPTRVDLQDRGGRGD